MSVEKIAAYVGALVAFGLGVVLLWAPPAAIAGQAGTVGTAFSFITGALAAVGVTVTIPLVRAAALEEGIARGLAGQIPPS